VKKNKVLKTQKKIQIKFLKKTSKAL
jgi:hypothetical protein